MNGRAILADEVGLGKTIEAGMILKNYLNRGLVNKFLILVPASLGFQWTSEMVNKVGITDIFFNRKGRGWAYFDHQIASLDMAKRKQHSRYLLDINFDMIIVDEAHRLKNRNTLNWKFVNSLKKKYCLLLTATPIQNNIEELYSLISLLYPDLYRDQGEFKSKYVKDKYLARNVLDLKKELGEIMIRNSHAVSGVKIPERFIHHVVVKLSRAERTLYERVTEYVKREYFRRRSAKNSILNLITYQREVCSSSFALLHTLMKKNNISSELNEIYRQAKSIKLNSKMGAILDILKTINGQAIIFTEYRATQIYIAKYLEDRGYRTILFNGGFSSSGKEWIKFVFHQEKDILISTEAGSQGLNFQFCNVIINYDLPWNPMKLEQRIGRIHRLGQKRNVYIYNLVTKNTIEEKVLNLLYKKIRLFKSIIGEMEEVLVDRQKLKTLESDIMKIIAEAKNDDELTKGLENLSKMYIKTDKNEEKNTKYNKV